MERGPPCSIGKVEPPTAMISQLFCVESSWQGMKEPKLQVRTLPDGFFCHLNAHSYVAYAKAQRIVEEYSLKRDGCLASMFVSKRRQNHSTDFWHGLFYTTKLNPAKTRCVWAAGEYGLVADF